MMQSILKAETDVGSGTPTPSTILCVDVNHRTRLLTKWFLSSIGYAVDAASTAAEALAIFDAATHDLVIADDDLGGMTGEEMAHVIKIRSCATRVMLICKKPARSLACVDLVVQKPISLPLLRDKLEWLRSKHVTA